MLESDPFWVSEEDPDSSGLPRGSRMMKGFGDHYEVALPSVSLLAQTLSWQNPTGIQEIVLSQVRCLLTLKCLVFCAFLKAQVSFDPNYPLQFHEYLALNKGLFSFFLINKGFMTNHPGSRQLRPRD